jgi:hypothetical protein
MDDGTLSIRRTELVATKLPWWTLISYATSSNKGHTVVK